MPLSVAVASVLTAASRGEERCSGSVSAWAGEGACGECSTVVPRAERVAAPGVPVCEGDRDISEREPGEGFSSCDERAASLWHCFGLKSVIFWRVVAAGTAEGLP